MWFEEMLRGINNAWHAWPLLANHLSMSLSKLHVPRPSHNLIIPVNIFIGLLMSLEQESSAVGFITLAPKP